MIIDFGLAWYAKIKVANVKFYAQLSNETKFKVFYLLEFIINDLYSFLEALKFSSNVALFTVN